MTHLAIAIGCKAIQNGFDGSFTTCAARIDDLARGTKRRSGKPLASQAQPQVLVVDALGHLACPTQPISSTTSSTSDTSGAGR
jgi:DNA replication protein DnaC